MNYEHVRELLKEMKLDGISSVLDSRLEEWSKSGYLQIDLEGAKLFFMEQ